MPAWSRIGTPFTTTRTRDLYTVTGRVGYLFTPQLLGYVKGGGAWTNTYTEIRGNIPAPFLSESASADRQGYTVGGGLEYQFARGWSVFGEYNYADFGRKDINFTAGPGTIGAAHRQLDPPEHPDRAGWRELQVQLGSAGRRQVLRYYERT